MEMFRAFLEEYVEFLEEVAAAEGEKHAALLSYDSKRVEKISSNQQAINMRLAQMEKKRETEQERLGWGGLTFRKIFEQMDAAVQNQFVEIFERFARAVSDIKYFNKKSIIFAQDGLQALGVVEENSGSAAYGADGKRTNDGTGPVLFETKI